MTNALESAFGIQKPDPSKAMEEVAGSLERGTLPSRPSALLVARALRAVLAGQRDFLAAAGVRIRRGGRYETPEAKQAGDRKAAAAVAAVQSAPGASAAEKARYWESRLAPEGGVTQSAVHPQDDQAEMLARLREAGMEGLKYRAILRHAKRGGLSSK